MTIQKSTRAGAIMLLILSSSANALTPAPKKRPFDQVPGVVAACLSSPAAAWTV